MSGLKWAKHLDVHTLKTRLITIIVWKLPEQESVWRCKVYVRERERKNAGRLVGFDDQLADIVDIEAKDLKEAKGKAIFAAFDLVIAHAFASRET